jgi:hypothetical protein
MIDWNQGGWTGSLRRWAAREVKRHTKSNLTLRATRYSPSLHCLRGFMAYRPFTWFVAVYLIIDLAFVLLEVLSTSSLLPGFHQSWASSDPDLSLLIRDGNGFFIVAQVGALGIVSIAVGLVTLIAQQQNSNTDVQIYYHESLAQEVISSSVALLAVLCLQVFWPVHRGVQFLGLGISSVESEIALTAIHATWLFVNLAALGHFVALSLSFVHPEQREGIRERYTANWVIPNELERRLQRALYASAAEGIFSPAGANDSPVIAFGYDLDSTDQAEVEANFLEPVVLFDVWMKPLIWVIRRWWLRCQLHAETVDNPSGNQRGGFGRLSTRLVFRPSFDRPLEHRAILCVGAYGFSGQSHEKRTPHPVKHTRGTCRQSYCRNR